MKKLLKSILVALFWLGAWALLSRMVGQALLLPAPGAVLRRLGVLLLTGDFWRIVGSTLLRILLGVLGGILLGVLLAVLTSRFALLRALLSPLLGIIKSTPVASFIVLIVLWVGRDLLPAVIVVLMVLPVMWANVSAGIEGIPRELLELARVYRFSRARTLRRICLPALLPHFLSACRSALGLAWKAGVAAEVLTVPGVSVGKMLMEAKLYLEIPDLFAWTLVVILCSLLIEKLLVSAIGRLDRQRRRAGVAHD